MSRLLFFLIVFLPVFAVAQSSAKYASLIKKADTYYHTKNYKASCTTYTQAFRSMNFNVPPWDRFNAACSWALADVPDSAFYQLEFIVLNNNYADLEKLNTEGDLKSLHRDKRWKKLVESTKQNQEAKEAKLDKKLIAQLDTIMKRDQNNRNNIKSIADQYGDNSIPMKKLWAQINSDDSVNLIEVKKIIDTQGWLGADIIGNKGNSTLFLVIQHSDKKTQEQYLPMMREAVKNGNANASELALLEDRVALGQGKKQIYGSQIIQSEKTGKDTIAPIEDFANVDKRRASVGLGSLADYVSYWNIVLPGKSKPDKSVKLVSNDFETAMEIHDSIVGPVNTSNGIGTQRDFFWSLGYSEDNSAWFKFTIDHDTILSFDLVPTYYEDDYDFILFKCPAPDCIDNIRSNTVLPDRWCFSVNYDKNGSTGLSEYSKNEYLGPGPGLGYASALPVKAGETIYLMVNWPAAYHHTPRGFTLYFYNYWPSKPKGFAKQINPAKRPPPKAPLVLENVLFESNTTSLVKESTSTLDNLAGRMLSNKKMKIEIRGHTDDTGDEKVNLELSENRAKAIAGYLISKGVNESRLTWKGFGSKKPIANNSTEEGKKKNRRVEFVIIDL